MPERLSISDAPFAKSTHYLFRFPAKFHPPVVRALVERYTDPGDLLLDPFCGSGTLLVEAAIASRPSIGLDVDPLSVLVSNVKVSRFNEKSLRSNAQNLLASLERNRRPKTAYEKMVKTDLSEAAYVRELKGISEEVPVIPFITGSDDM